MPAPVRRNTQSQSELGEARRIEHFSQSIYHLDAEPFVLNMSGLMARRILSDSPSTHVDAEAAGKPRETRFIEEPPFATRAFLISSDSVEAESFVPHPAGRGFSIPDSAFGFVTGQPRHSVPKLIRRGRATCL